LIRNVIPAKTEEQWGDGEYKHTEVITIRGCNSILLLQSSSQQYDVSNQW